MTSPRAGLLLIGLLGLMGREAVAQENYLTVRDIHVIRGFWQNYAWASKKTNVPVAILPAMHYRESNLYIGWHSQANKKVVKNIGGPFMLDFGPLNDPIKFTKRIRKYESFVASIYNYHPPIKPKVSHDFRFAILVAAHHLKKKSKCSLLDEECLADAVWGYNGRASWHLDHRASPYVWSDPMRRLLLTMRYKRANGEVVEFIDTRPGVMVIYREILDLIKKGVLP